jgi:hypothetical protein
LRLKNSFGICANLSEQDPAARLLGILEAEHNFSPAKARAFLRLLEEYGQEHNEHRPSGTVIYHAVSDRGPPGKPISECRLIPVKLTLVSPEDEAYLDLDATSRLKWQRILRYTTEAKAQGAYLSQPDLVFLLGVHPGCPASAGPKQEGGGADPGQLGRHGAGHFPHDQGSGALPAGLHRDPDQAPHRPQL